MATRALHLRRRGGVRSVMAAVLLVTLAAGCGEVPLYSNIKEREANEMMAALQREGISCSKKTGEENSWTLTVPPSSFSRAVQLLSELGYPKDDYQGIGESFKKSGLVSSPTEERIRFMHALSQELAATISRIDGVLVARVHVVLPENNPLSESTEPASASVFIKYRRGTNLEPDIPEIKQLVVNGIEGLKYDAVSIVMLPADDPAEMMTGVADDPYVDVMQVRMAPDSVPRFWTLLGSVAAIAVVNLAVGGVALWRWRLATAKLAAASPGPHTP